MHRHVETQCAWCRTRGRFEYAHGGVFESTHGFEEVVVASSAYQIFAHGGLPRAPEVHQRNIYIFIDMYIFVHIYMYKKIIHMCHHESIVTDTTTFELEFFRHKQATAQAHVQCHCMSLNFEHTKNSNRSQKISAATEIEFESAN